TVVVISTGSQGEPMSALSLMAAREHKYVALQPGDAVVLSSSVIPGNETSIHRVLDGLYRSGADVFHVPVWPVHVSGHASAEEGIVLVVVTVDAHTGEVLAGPDVVNRGFVFDDTSGHILEEAAARALASLKEAEAEEVSDPQVLKQHIRRSLGKYFYEQTKRKPVIVPVIMEV